MFWWGGCRRQAANFFYSLDTCKWSCERPSISRLPRECTDNFDPIYSESCAEGLWKELFYFHHETGECTPFWYDGCISESQNIFQDLVTCKAMCEHKADEDIGKSLQPQEEFRCLEPKETGPCKDTYPAFFYDRTLRQCKPFSYSGCGGNGNRFLTIGQCQSLCKPFEVLSEPETDCFLPLDTGHSDGECEKNADVAFFFDKLKGKCVEFWFRGCGGNDNRFTSFEVCQRSCIQKRSLGPPLLRNTRDVHACFEASTDKGSCQGQESPVQRYSYQDQKCVLFTYSGCGGTNNRFSSMEECRRLCDGLKPSLTPAVCSFDANWGTCSLLRYEWFFNMTTGFCQQFLYGGCGGNSNRFSTFEACQSTCEVTGTDACSDPLDRGRWCEAMSNRYYFNKRSMSCRGFHYTGCGNSKNNFKTLKECKARCDKRGKRSSPRKRPKVVQAAPTPVDQHVPNEADPRTKFIAVRKYSGVKPIEKTAMQEHIILEGSGQTYQKTQAEWVDYRMCFAYRYNITGFEAKLETHLCAKDSSEDCWSELMEETGGDEYCHVVKPFLKGVHKYTWFFSLTGGPYETGIRKLEGLRAAVLTMTPSHCDSIC